MYEYIGINHRGTTEIMRRVFLNMSILSEELGIDRERHPEGHQFVEKMKQFYLKEAPSPTAINTVFKRTEGEFGQNLLLQYGMLLSKNGADENDMKEVATLLNEFNGVLPRTYRYIWWLELADNYPQEHTRSIYLRFLKPDFYVWEKFLEQALESKDFLVRTDVTDLEILYLKSLHGSYHFNVTDEDDYHSVRLTLQSWSLVKQIVDRAIEAVEEETDHPFGQYREELHRFKEELSYASITR